MAGRQFNPATDDPACISDDIDRGERLIPLTRINDLSWIPRRAGSKPISISAIYKWADAGVNGKVLETANGPIKSTTEGALRRFYDLAPKPILARRLEGA